MTWSGNKFYWHNKLIGWRISGNCFIMRKKETHIYRKFNSIGCEKEILINLIKNGIREIRILMQDGNVYSVSPLEWLKSDLEVEWKGDIQKHFEISKMRKPFLDEKR